MTNHLGTDFFTTCKKMPRSQVKTQTVQTVQTEVFSLFIFNFSQSDQVRRRKPIEYNNEFITETVVLFYSERRVTVDFWR